MPTSHSESSYSKLVVAAAGGADDDFERTTAVEDEEGGEGDDEVVVSVASAPSVLSSPVAAAAAADSADSFIGPPRTAARTATDGHPSTSSRRTIDRAGLPSQCNGSPPGGLPAVHSLRQAKLQPSKLSPQEFLLLLLVIFYGKKICWLLLLLKTAHERWQHLFLLFTHAEEGDDHLLFG
jgi:hypothetical protein